MTLDKPRRAAQSDFATSCIMVAIMFMTAAVMLVYLYNEPAWHASPGPKFALVRTVAGSTFVADYDMTGSDCRALAAVHTASRCVEQRD